MVTTPQPARFCTWRGESACGDVGVCPIPAGEHVHGTAHARVRRLRVPARVPCSRPPPRRHAHATSTHREYDTHT
eukprot:3316257-Prymnesium_polylepis.1